MIRLIERDLKGAEKGLINFPLDPEFLRASNQIHTHIKQGGLPPDVGSVGGEQVFRLTTNRGAWDQNKQSGLLRLTVAPRSQDGTQTIKFLQVSVDGGSTNRQGGYNPHAAVCRVEGEMSCKEGRIIAWKLDSGMYHVGSIGSIPIGGTHHRETGRVLDTSLEVTIGEKVYQRKRNLSPFFTEWNLLTLVGSLPFDSSANFKLCLFEGLSLQKADCQLIYTGRHEAPRFGGELHSFALIGRGIVPLDYWLDSNHYLVCCVSGGLGRGFVPEGLMKPPSFDFAVRDFNT